MNLGEWWYTDTGELLWADGEGDTPNHETHVMGHAQMLIADAMGVRHEGCDQPAFVEKMLELLEPANCETLSDAARRWARENGRLEIIDLWPAATDCDLNAREFAVQQWDWIWVRVDEIGIAVHDLTHLTRIRRLLAAIEEETDADIDRDTLELQVNVMRDGKIRRLRVTWFEIDSLRTVGPEVSQPARRSQRDELMPAFYRQRVGD